MTATPHDGKEEDFQLFMALRDGDRFEGRFRDGVHTTDVSDLMRRMVKAKPLRFELTPQAAFAADKRIRGVVGRRRRHRRVPLAPPFNICDLGAASACATTSAGSTVGHRRVTPASPG